MEHLKSDVMCGGGPLFFYSLPMMGIGRFEKVLKPYDTPPGMSQLNYYAAESDISIFGMTLVGTTLAGDKTSNQLMFRLPPAEVFSRLPGKPKMENLGLVAPGSGITLWVQAGKSQEVPRLQAHSYKDVTFVYCKYDYYFKPKTKY